MTGKKTMGYDCVIIPGAAKAASPYTNLVNQAFCGAGGLATAKTSTAAFTVCCKFFLV